MKVYERIIKAIDELIGSTKLPASVTLDALENIRDHVEPWIDAIQDDVDREVTEAMEEDTQ